MMMSESEIISSYKNAADKEAQLTVLAELNACSTADIMSICMGDTQKKKRQIYDKYAIAKCIEAGFGILETAQRLGYDTSTTGFKQTYWKVKKSLELYSSNDDVDTKEIADKSDNIDLSSSSTPMEEENDKISVTSGMMPLNSAKLVENNTTKPRAVPKKIIPKDVKVGFVSSSVKLESGDKKDGSAKVVKQVRGRKSKAKESSKEEVSKKSVKVEDKSIIEENVSVEESKVIEEQAVMIENIVSEQVTVEKPVEVVEEQIVADDKESVVIKKSEESVAKDSFIQVKVSDFGNRDEVDKSEDENASEIQHRGIKESMGEIDKEMGIETKDLVKSGIRTDLDYLRRLVELHETEVRVKLEEVELELESLKLRHSYLLRVRQSYVDLLSRKE